MNNRVEILDSHWLRIMAQPEAYSDQDCKEVRALKAGADALEKVKVLKDELQDLRDCMDSINALIPDKYRHSLLAVSVQRLKDRIEKLEKGV